MTRLERVLDKLTPKRWPVRWRLAAVSATLTLVILVIFALVVGRLTSNRLQADFNDDVHGTAATIAGLRPRSKSASKVARDSALAAPQHGDTRELRSQVRSPERPTDPDGNRNVLPYLGPVTSPRWAGW